MLAGGAYVRCEDKVPVMNAGPSASRDLGPGLFDHWGAADLAAAGLSDGEIAALRACRAENDLFTLDVDEETLSLLIDLLSQTPEQWRNPALDAEEATTERIRRAILEHGALAGISPLFGADEIGKLTRGPIEDWMVFLHPDQRTAVDRRYDGPARVRGSAGTGKTVVARHRAAALIRRFEAETSSPRPGDNNLLFTTFIKSLPPVFEQLYHRLPASRPDDPIEFRHIDSLAYKVCAEAGDCPTIDPRKVDSTFATACMATFPVAPTIRDYLRDEVTQVIKGRGIGTLDEYLAIDGTGRKTRLPESLRRQVWALKQRWDQELETAGVMDFPDVIERATYGLSMTLCPHSLSQNLHGSQVHKHGNAAPTLVSIGPGRSGWLAQARYVHPGLFDRSGIVFQRVRPAPERHGQAVLFRCTFESMAYQVRFPYNEGRAVVSKDAHVIKWVSNTNAKGAIGDKDPGDLSDCAFHVGYVHQGVVRDDNIKCVVRERKHRRVGQRIEACRIRFSCIAQQTGGQVEGYHAMSCRRQVPGDSALSATDFKSTSAACRDDCVEEGLPVVRILVMARCTSPAHPVGRLALPFGFGHEPTLVVSWHASGWPPLASLPAARPGGRATPGQLPCSSMYLVS
jgi:hypothetical protein